MKNYILEMLIQKTLNDFTKHAATKEFIKDNNYRFKSNSIKVNKLNQNMDTLGGALTGLVKARAGQLAEGAESKLTIVDAAYGLLTQGVIKDVEEAVHHGWAILKRCTLKLWKCTCSCSILFTKESRMFNKAKQRIKQ